MNKFLNKWGINVPLDASVVEANPEIDWTYIGIDEADFKLVQLSDTTVSVRPTTTEFMLRTLLLLVGSGLVFGAINTWDSQGFWNQAWAKWFVLFFGILLCVGGGVYYLFKYLFTFKKRFSKTNNQYMYAKEKSCALADIKALQLVFKRYAYNSFSNKSASNPNIFIYQLNVVLKDNNRIEVLTNGTLAKIRSDARTLSTFLQVPILDGINDAYIAVA